MVNIRLGNQKKFILDQKGQSSVEYILLFAMIAIIATTLFNSEPFQKMFGSNGIFAKTYKEEIEFSYHHAHGGRKEFVKPNYNSPNHSSYIGPGGTRFFGANDAYPK